MSEEWGATRARMRPAGVVSFLTDFGLGDAYVGVVKGVMLSINPGLRVVDLSHEISPQDVQEGAFQLMTAVGYFPKGTVHLAVVDPGVGTERRAVAVEVAGHGLVGPDNGLLSWAARQLAAEQGQGLGKAEGSKQKLDGGQGEAELGLAVAPPLAAVELTQSHFWRHPVSATFHARDIFGPVAAHLASGVALAEFGPPVERLASLPFPRPRRPSRRRLVGQVVHVDRFGNLVTNLPAELVPPDAGVMAGTVAIQGLRSTYGHDKGPTALIGSAGYLEVAVPGGSAAEQLGLKRGDPIEVELP